MKTYCLTALLLLMESMTLCAQKPCESVRIGNNGKATIWCRDKGYDKLYINGSFEKKDKVRMTLVDSLWLYATDSLASDMYTYHFIDDDDKVILDNENPNVARDIDQKYNFFIVDGTPGKYYMDREVPHGKIDTVWYSSSFDEQMPERRMLVYLPPSYKKSHSRKYPVLYLLHGTGGDETSWCDMGRLAQIMDNMLAEKKIVPMIVVMPNGIVDQDAAPGEGRYLNTEAKHVNVKSWMGRTEAAFPKEVLPYVEKHYRTVNDKEHRAIAGLSMGGMHASAIAANNPDLFDYVGLFSPQSISGLTDGNIRIINAAKNFISDMIDFIPVSEDTRERFYKNQTHVADIGIYKNIDEKLLAYFKTNPKLHYIAIGRDDSLRKFLKAWLKFMDKNECKYYYNETEGGHSWDNWRRYLIDFAPRLFNK